MVEEGDETCRQPREAGEGEEPDSPLDPPESNAALQSEILTSEFKAINSRCFKP